MCYKHVKLSLSKETPYLASVENIPASISACPTGFPFASADLGTLGTKHVCGVCSRWIFCNTSHTLCSKVLRCSVAVDRQPCVSVCSYSCCREAGAARYMFHKEVASQNVTPCTSGSQSCWIQRRLNSR